MVWIQLTQRVVMPHWVAPADVGIRRWLRERELNLNLRGPGDLSYLSTDVAVKSSPREICPICPQTWLWKRVPWRLVLFVHRRGCEIESPGDLSYLSTDVAVKSSPRETCPIRPQTWLWNRVPGRLVLFVHRRGCEIESPGDLSYLSTDVAVKSSPRETSPSSGRRVV